MTLEWKPYKDKESVFWSQFKKDGDIGLVTKFKGSGDGYNPDASIKPEFQGYVYWAKQAQGKKGPFWVIERKKTSSLGEDSEYDIAHRQTLREMKAEDEKEPTNWEAKQAKIEKAHQENLVAQQNINETLIAILGELRRIADAQEAKHEI